MIKKSIKIIKISLAIASLTLFSCALQASDTPVNQFDVKYVNLPNTTFVDIDDEKIDTQVLYFFSYGCLHCYNFENYTQHFIKNKSENISFLPVPISSTPAWSEYTKAFMIAESLGLNIRKKIFEQVHVKGEKILTKDALRAFFAENYDISSKVFESFYNSFSIDYKINKYEKLADLYDVSGTPTIVVIKKNGRAAKTSPSITGNLYNTIASTVYLSK